ncbi:MAG: F0F1 ATP synthase subunit epsilon [Gammaproteobacteria bacterium]
MRLIIILPTEILVDEKVSKIIAEAENGWFCLEPRHIDFVTSLVPSLLTYVTADGNEMFVGIDEGILVKCGREVRISASDAVAGANPAELKPFMRDRLSGFDEHERSARTVLARLEAGVAKRFVELQKGR